MAVVSTRYAEALLNSADKEKETFQKGLETLSELYSSNLEFKETIDNPRISNETKLEIIKQIVPNNQVFINFIDLVLKEGRINLIADISKKYRDMVNRLNKKITMEIISACELTEKEIKEITDKYQKIYDANEVENTVKVDETLIGGIKVIIDGKVYDDTIRTKLKEML